MSVQKQFFDDAAKAFGFLEQDFGFRVSLPNGESTLESVRFHKPPLQVDVGWYKGEVDAGIHASIDTSILRPYRRKRFCLTEVINHLKPGIFKTGLGFPSSTCSRVDAASHLAILAELTKVHCADILRGDIQALEMIVKMETQESRE